MRCFFFSLLYLSLFLFFSIIRSLANSIFVIFFFAICWVFFFLFFNEMCTHFLSVKCIRSRHTKPAQQHTAFGWLQETFWEREKNVLRLKCLRCYGCVWFFFSFSFLVAFFSSFLFIAHESSAEHNHLSSLHSPYDNNDTNWMEQKLSDMDSSAFARLCKCKWNCS